ncbi:hypothetical protein K8R66_03015 [bacterium]|nr:hypothetical protein [bacterium]
MSLDIDQQISRAIDSSKNILLLAPLNYSGDCLASVLGFYNYLTENKRDKNIDFILPQKPKKIHSFLSKIYDAKFEADKLRRLVFSIDTTKVKVKEIDYSEDGDKLNIFLTSSPTELKPQDVSVFFKNYYDLIIIFNSPDLKSLGKVFSDYPNFFHQTPIINIDNQAANERYGQINFVDLAPSSVSEQMFNFLSLNKKFISRDVAQCFLTGLISATKGFSNDKVTPKSLEVASKLIDLGADREKIIYNLYQTKTISLLKVWGQILSELNYDANYKIAWASLDLKKDDERQIEVEELIEELISKASQAEIIVLFQVLDNNLLKIYIYSNYRHDSFGLVRGLAEGRDVYGNGDLLSFEVNGLTENVQHRVLDILRENINNQL